MTTCSTVSLLTRSPRHPNSPAVVEAVAGCVHEHVATQSLCIECWIEALVAEDKGVLLCHDCLTGADEHKCKVEILEATDLTDEPPKVFRTKSAAT